METKMSIFTDGRVDSKISKDEAMRLLFDGISNENTESQYMDEYGNYVFPTDLVANTPNTAVGTPNGLYAIGLSCL